MSTTVTINDIAKKAGVGKATVSRVINNSGYVKAETREKIEKIMEELDYLPSSVAKNLSKRRSDLIAFIVPQIENAFYAEVLKGISNVIEKEGYTLIVCNTDNDTAKDLKALETIYKQKAAGIIYTPVKEYSDKEEDLPFWKLFSKIDFPCILLDRPLCNTKIKFDQVLSDNYQATYTATQALIDAGHSNIGAVFANINNYVSKKRYEGFKKALSDNGLRLIKSQVAICEKVTYEQAYVKSKRLLGLKERPTAVFCGNNICGVGFLKAVFEQGMKIPDDIGYIGYDDIPILNVFGNHYSCMNRNLETMGQKAARLLLERIEDIGAVKETTRVIMKSELCLRGSEIKCVK